MAANSSAHSAKSGYNQSGGAYFVCVTALSGSSGTGVTPVTSATLSANSSYLYKITVAGSKSGGAYVEPTLDVATAQEVIGVTVDKADEVVTEYFTQGRLIKDMGKTVISGDRTYRKFAVAATGLAYNKSLGVAGSIPVAPGAGYGTFYLDVGRNGTTGGTLPAPIARYF
jgi:hypothetical protein